MSFFTTTWGDVAGLAGFVVSSFGLSYAFKAEREARAAKTAAVTAGKAADAAKAEARRQNLADELRDAQAKVADVGKYLAQQKWEIVLLRAQEAVTACSHVLRRWGPENLGAEARQNILRSQELVASIARQAVIAPTVQPSAQDLKRMSAAQQKAFQWISGEFAGHLGAAERGR